MIIIKVNESLRESDIGKLCPSNSPTRGAQGTRTASSSRFSIFWTYSSPTLQRGCTAQGTRTALSSWQGWYWMGMLSSSSKSTQNSSTEFPSPKIWTSTLWGKVIFEPTCPNNSGGGKLIRQFSKEIMSIFWGVPLKMSKDDGWYIICGIMNNMWGVLLFLRAARAQLLGGENIPRSDPSSKANSHTHQQNRI